MVLMSTLNRIAAKFITGEFQFGSRKKIHFQLTVTKTG
jgi:hypothetical protein